MENDGKYICRSLEMTFEENKETEENTGTRKIEGLAVVFNRNTDIGGLFYETIAPGAFDKTDMSDVALYLNHDNSKLPLARCRKTRSKNSLKIWTDGDGLRMQTELDVENNADSRALCSAIERGDVDGMSFYGVVGSDKWTDLGTDMPKRTILSFKKLCEISAVVQPAYDDTSIGFSRAKKALESDKIALERAKADEDERVKENSAQIEMMKQKIQMM